MKFLYVLCVVLNLKYADCLEPVYNNPSVLYQNQKNAQIYGHREFQNPPLLRDYNQNIGNTNYETREVGVLSKSISGNSEPYSGERFRHKEQSTPQYVNKKIIQTNSDRLKANQDVYSEVIRKPINEEQNILINQNKNTFSREILPRKSINQQNGYTQRPEEEIRLELQGVSPEYIKSLINQNPPVLHNTQQSSLIAQSRPLNVPQNIKPANYATVKTASYQNPSAELLYKSNQATPYRINSNIFTNNHQGNNNIGNIMRNLGHLEDIYSSHSSKPQKRYTVVHPDGRIEYIDELERIKEKHPNYVLLHSSDVIKHFKNANTNPLSSSNSPKPYTIENGKTIVEQVSNNKNNQISPIINILTTSKDTLTSSDISNKKTLPDNVNTTIASELKATTDTDISKSAIIDVNIISSSVPTTNVSDVFENINITNTVDLKLPHRNTTEYNVTQISSKFEPLNTTEIKEKRTDSNAALIIPPHDIGAIIIKKNVNKTTTKDKQIIRSGLVQSETSLSEGNKTNTNEMYNVTTSKENDSVGTSESNISLSSNDETSKNSTFLFAPDNQFWDKIINNKDNVFYFLFVPPKPKTRDTKTTIYPNGTTVTEVTEIVDGDDTDSPDKSQPMIITQKNDTVI